MYAARCLRCISICESTYDVLETFYRLSFLADVWMESVESINCQTSLTLWCAKQSEQSLFSSSSSALSHSRCQSNLVSHSSDDLARFIPGLQFCILPSSRRCRFIFLSLVTCSPSLDYGALTLAGPSLGAPMRLLRGFTFAYSFQDFCSMRQCSGSCMRGVFRYISGALTTAQ